MTESRRPGKFDTLKSRVYLYVASYGMWSLLKELAHRGLLVVASAMVWMALLPVSIPLHLFGYRRLTVLVSRIGHLAIEVDSLLKEQAMGHLPQRKWLLLAPTGRVANAHLLRYWKAHLRVVENPFLCMLLGMMSRWLVMKYDVSRYFLRLNETAEAFSVNAQWSGRPPVLELSAADREWGASQLRVMGLPEGMWFVCVHVREPGYSPSDEVTHAHRNGRPEAVIPAINEIVRRGGWCIRMGDPSTTKLPMLPGVIDYAHHPLRSPRLDIVLCAMARFFLGNSSGLAFASSVFGVPTAFANMIPLSAMGLLPTDITIHKLHQRKSSTGLLSFTEILGSRIGDFRYAKLFADEQIVVLENSPEEVLDLVREMMDRLDGRFVRESDDERLQRCFVQLLRPGHYSYGAASRIGVAFLRKYRDLLRS